MRDYVTCILPIWAIGGTFVIITIPAVFVGLICVVILGVILTLLVEGLPPRNPAKVSEVSKVEVLLKL